MTRPAWVRLAYVALWLNAALASLATAAMVIGLAPHSAQEPFTTRRLAASEFAGALLFALTAKRVQRDATILLLPAAFVSCKALFSLSEFARTGAAFDLPPLVAEATFATVYWLALRATGRTESPSVGPANEKL